MLSWPRRSMSSKSGGRMPPPLPPEDDVPRPQGPLGPPVPLPFDELLVQGMRPLFLGFPNVLGNQGLGGYMCIAAGAQTPTG